MRKRLILSMAAILLVAGLSGCLSLGEADIASFEGTVTDVSKYGNITTTIQEAELTAAGYQLGDLLEASFDNERVIQAPFVTTYSDVDKGDYLVRSDEGQIALAINYGNFAGDLEVGEGSSLTLSLAEKGAYKDEFDVRHLERTEARGDYSSDEVFANFREISMGEIPSGLLFRSCHPSNGEARAPYVNELVKEAGIQTVVNLADSQEELESKIDEDSYYGELYAQGRIVLLDMGVDFKDPEFHAKLKEGLEFVLVHEGPYLVHCNEGKDRAGMVSALLEALGGASYEEIVEDYMVTYENYYHVQKEDPKYEIISRFITSILTDINQGAAVDTNTDLVSMAENYLVDVIGLQPGQVELLRSGLQGKLR